MGGKCVGACSVEGCEKRVLARKLCSMHYYRLMHHGGIGAAQSTRPGGDCSIDGCGRPHKGYGYCGMHLRRLHRWGDSDVVGVGGRPWKDDAPGWAAIHKRLARERGKATDYSCVDCHGPAREWSYDGRDANELVGEANGFMLAYSLELAHYEPRCSSCHRKYDNAIRKGARAHFIVTVTVVDA